MGDRIITGTTKSGFEFSLDRLALDDFDLVELVAEVADPDTDFVTKSRDISRIVEKLLGPEQKDALNAHIREQNDGRLSISQMEKAILEIMSSTKESKNS